MGTSNAQEVAIGGWVKVRDSRDTEDEVYQLVDDAQVDYAANKISARSLLVKAILGLKPGDSVSYETPHGTANVTIVSAGRGAPPSTP
jgi:transcription elongation GreA/GreB family factor